MATATVKRSEPVKPKIEKVILELSLEEARAVKGAIGKVTGSGDKRNAVDAIYYALTEIDSKGYFSGGLKIEGR